MRVFLESIYVNQNRYVKTAYFEIKNMNFYEIIFFLNFPVPVEYTRQLPTKKFQGKVDLD